MEAGDSSHSGRRWFITRLAHAGISPKAIMMLAGHRHPSTTQRYIDVKDEMTRCRGDPPTTTTALCSVTIPIAVQAALAIVAGLGASIARM
nr:site-specific integrase [Methylobacterium sp. WL103]